MYRTASKIVDRIALQRLLASWRIAPVEIVFSNGCFDLLHLGHVDYLEKAAACGDKLVIGLNSDASVRRLKGLHRPLQDEQARARILAALEFVDAVVIFGEDTPADLISLVQPDVLVKGADYALEDIVGGREVLDRGGRVERIEFVEGHSTTSIVERIRQQP